MLFSPCHDILTFFNTGILKDCSEGILPSFTTILQVHSMSSHHSYRFDSVVNQAPHTVIWRHTNVP